MAKNNVSGLLLSVLAAAGMIWVYFSDIILGAKKVVLGPRSYAAFIVFGLIFFCGLAVFKKAKVK